MTKHECPKCGDSFDSEHAMKTHYGLSEDHEGSIAGVETSCDQCGTSLRIKRYRVEADGQNFCSAECRGQWISENLSGEDSHAWEGGMVTTTCDQCGAEIQKPRYKVRKYDRNFCGADCRSDWLSDNHVGEQHTQYTSLTVNCEYCGTELEREPHHAERRENHFCNHDCYGSWLTKTGQRRGSNSSRWKGGYEPYGEGWNDRKKQRVRDRDDYQCQSCGMTNEEHRDEYDRQLEVHHITPARRFDDAATANAAENLVTLCISCHRLYEGTDIAPDAATR